MALVPAVLVAGFTAAPEQTDPSTAAAQFATIYNTYALAATAGATVVILTGGEEARFAAALEPQFATANGTPADAAAAFVQAMTEFWLTPPVAFGSNPPPVPLGAVNAFLGAAALQAALVALFSAPNTTATFAAGLASALDIATRTVTVLLPGPVTVNVS